MKQTISNETDLICSLYATLTSVLNIFGINSLDDITCELGEWGIDSYRAEYALKEAAKIRRNIPNQTRISCDLR